MEHTSSTDVLCARFQNDKLIDKWIKAKRVFMRFEFKNNFL